MGVLLHLVPVGVSRECKAGMGIQVRCSFALDRGFGLITVVGIALLAASHLCCWQAWEHQANQGTGILQSQACFREVKFNKADSISLTFIVLVQEEIYSWHLMSMTMVPRDQRVIPNELPTPEGLDRGQLDHHI